MTSAVPEIQQVVSCLGGDRTAIDRRPVPQPGAGEMLLGLRVVGFCGTDLFKLVTGTASVGTVLGHELVGEVAALGEGVTSFALGDRIAVPHHVPCGQCGLCRRGSETMCETFRENLLEPGGFADFILVRPRATGLAARRLPDTVSDEAAVFMEPAACVLRGVHRAGLPENGAALILGGGSMGLLHLLVLKAVYPNLAVILVDPLVHRRALAEQLGADGMAEPGDDTDCLVRRMTASMGVDAVFDTVGGKSTLAAGLELSRQGGSVVLFAHAPDGQQADFDLNSLFKYERRIIGTYSAALTEQAEIFELLCSGRFDPRPLVTHRLPLDSFEVGLSLVREHKALKVLFTPSQSSVA